MMKNMEAIELIDTLFTDTRNTINQRLDLLERQITLIMHSQRQCEGQPMNCCMRNNFTGCQDDKQSDMSSELFAQYNAVSQKLSSMSAFLDQMNYRLKQIEENTKEPQQKSSSHLRTPILGPQHLEGLVIVPEIKVSKKDESDLDTKNIVIQPHFTLPISDCTSVDSDIQQMNQTSENEDVDVEEQEVEEEQVEEEEVVEEEEEQVEEVVEEEEEVVEEEEALELEEFIYKSKKYFKDQFNKVYRQIDEETPEDEPFAEYNETTKTLKKLPV